jgi:hypothetical protein
VADDALTNANDAHLFAHTEYAANQPFLAAALPSASAWLYEPVAAPETLSNCCGHLLSTIGLQILYSENAERLRPHMHSSGAPLLPWPDWWRRPNRTASADRFPSRPSSLAGSLAADRAAIQVILNSGALRPELSAQSNITAA